MTITPTLPSNPSLVVGMPGGDCHWRPCGEHEAQLRVRARRKTAGWIGGLLAATDDGGHILRQPERCCARGPATRIRRYVRGIAKPVARLCSELQKAFRPVENALKVA